MKGTGLLIGGVVVPVEGLDITNRHDADWARLDTRDYRMRKTSWPRQVFAHTTKGIHPQHVIPGAGPGGMDEFLADFFRRETKQSATHLGVDTDGTVGCFADLKTICAYHATLSNDYAVGFEMYQLGNGGIYEATLDAAVKLTLAICDAMMIPLQIAGDVYRNAPIERMVGGGPDCVGIFGHRDNTHDRGRGDPGDEYYVRMIAAGAEPLRFSEREDIAVWKRRQQRLNSWGAKLTVDGLAGIGTMTAMKQLGFKHGREIDVAVEDPRNV